MLKALRARWSEIGNWVRVTHISEYVTVEDTPVAEIRRRCLRERNTATGRERLVEHPDRTKSVVWK